MKEGFDEGFGARLRELLGSDSVNAFAKRCEVPEASMRAYLEGKVPTADRAFRIAQRADADFEWLVAGVMAGVARNAITRAPNRNDVDIVATGDGMTFAVEMKGQVSPEFALVPRLDIEASAGDGRLAETEDPLEYLAFQRGWLKARGINPERARILTARGDSMEETIRDGDVLLIDTSIDRIRDNAIYIVVYGDMVLVKRVHGRINGSLQLISDNPRYPAEEVTAAEVDQLNIAGRVMWFGRTI
ncbi:S24 family peptidase [Shinella kummerowiae]|uniref:S24 family peptidase n=1 Tax=Shinella kummerowiae TaxID=417745 RepID=UPI0021B595CE|nr:helix-turn-helix transcriptional regulator [Shinella kummerowiae]